VKERVKTTILPASIFLLCIAIVALVVFVWSVFPVISINRATLQMAANDFSSASLIEWNNTIEQYGYVLGIDSEATVLENLKEYSEAYARFNQDKLVELIPIQVEILESNEQEVPIPQRYSIDKFLPVGVQYIHSAGKAGLVEISDISLQIGNDETQEIQLAKQLLPAQPDIIRQGTNDWERFEPVVRNLLEQFLEAAMDNDQETALQFAGADTQNLNLGKFQFISIDSLVLVLAGETLPELGELVPVVSISADKFRCPDELALTVAYNPEDSRLEIMNVSQVQAQICTPAPSSINHSCTDCSLAPVDKIYRLAASYIPMVEPTGLTGGGNLVSEAAQALRDIFAAAAAQGIPMTVVSAYRSYEVQVNTFEYWVQIEQSKGYSRGVAEQRANTYSAMPGHSEHQLGTAVDIGCVNCFPFANSPENQVIYSFLEAYAHEYGFVVSYPPDSEALTGYQYEPWHLRYVGKDMAEAMMAQNYITAPNVFVTWFLYQLGRY